jgi:hypothetical protein
MVPLQIDRAMMKTVPNHGVAEPSGAPANRAGAGKHVTMRSRRTAPRSKPVATQKPSREGRSVSIVR